MVYCVFPPTLYTVIVKGPMSNGTVVLSLMEIMVTLVCMYIPAVFTGRGQLYPSVHAEKLEMREWEMAW